MVRAYTALTSTFVHYSHNHIPLSSTHTRTYQNPARQFIYTSHFDPSECPSCNEGKLFSRLGISDSKMFYYVGIRERGCLWVGVDSTSLQSNICHLQWNVWGCRTPDSTLLQAHHVFFALRAFISFFTSAENNETRARFCSAELDKHFCKLNNSAALRTGAPDVFEILYATSLTLPYCLSLTCIVIKAFWISRAVVWIIQKCVKVDNHWGGVYKTWVFAPRTDFTFVTCLILLDQSSLKACCIK